MTQGIWRLEGAELHRKMVMNDMRRNALPFMAQTTR